MNIQKQVVYQSTNVFIVFMFFIYFMSQLPAHAIIQYTKSIKQVVNLAHWVLARKQHSYEKNTKECQHIIWFCAAAR